MESASGGRLVMLGDSMVQLHDWQRRFPRAHVLNHGLKGDTAERAHGRLSVALSEGAARLFLHVGTNDIWRGVPQVETLRWVRQILSGFRMAHPTAPIAVHGILPRADGYVAEVAALNDAYGVLSGEIAGLTYIAPPEGMADAHGILRPEFARDEYCHLTKEGYRFWSKALAASLGAWGVDTRMAETTRPRQPA